MIRKFRKIFIVFKPGWGNYKMVELIQDGIVIVNIQKIIVKTVKIMEDE